MKLIRVGAAVLNQTPLDWDGNAARIRGAIADARKAGVSILCLPELCITGYGCEDVFHAPGTRVAGDQTGEDRFGVLPPRVVEGLERLVGEVRHVAGLEVAVVGGRREEEVGRLPAVGTAAEGRYEAAFGPFGVPHLDEPAKPAPEREEVGRGIRKWLHREARRRPGAVVGHGREAMVSSS